MFFSGSFAALPLCSSMSQLHIFPLCVTFIHVNWELGWDVSVTVLKANLAINTELMLIILVN